MRLLELDGHGGFSLVSFRPSDIPSYAILSHTWEADDQEVTFEDVSSGMRSGKIGFKKIGFCGKQAQKDGLRYFWVDSCCILKTSSAELQEAINSMWRWYKDAAKCYVYLSDVSGSKRSHSSEPDWESTFKGSRWFTRGWTLQELLAPRSVEFFARDEKRLGNKTQLQSLIHEATGIAIAALHGEPLSHFSIDERHSWAAKRQTTVEEDQIYCLLGIFGVHLPLIYGEGKANATLRLQDEIKKATRVHSQASLSENAIKCLQALRTSEYEEFKDRNPDRIEGTCRWFLQHDSFTLWQNSKSGLLFVTADPGCGKSVLAKSLIDHELKSNGSRITCHFFFKEDNDKQRSSTLALSAILHQLFSQRPSLLTIHAIEEYIAEGDRLSQSFHKLWGILVEAATNPRAGEVVCVLDALDECAEQDQYRFIDILRAFYNKNQGISQLRFVITSRPYLYIERRLSSMIQNFPAIHLRGDEESEAISREISIVVQSKISSLGWELGLDDSEQSLLKSELLVMEHRTYLWLKLIFEVIRDEIGLTKNRLKNLIGTLPTTVEQAYEAILSKAKDQKKARRLLHIVVGAKRPLSLGEMNIALAIEDHHRCDEDLDLEDEARFQKTLRNLCGLFVTIVDQKVYLIHQTAKEFLVATTGSKQLLNGWKHSLDPVDSDILLSTIMINYLLFETIPSQGHFKKLFQYAVSFWAQHFQSAQYRVSNTLIQSALTLCSPYSIWLRNTITFDLKRCNSMWVASHYGFEEIIKHQLLKDSAQVKLNGDVRIIHGEDLAIQSYLPLGEAALNGYEGIVRRLLEAGAHVDLTDLRPVFDLRDSRGSVVPSTPLLKAVSRARKGIVILLLQAGANPDLGTPLFVAVGRGMEEIVKLLLEADADTNLVNDENLTPLFIAAMSRKHVIVKLLLDFNANANAKDKQNRTVLSHAASVHGSERIVKLLLKANANVHLADEKNRTPLSYAAGCQNVTVVQLLLEAGADAHFMDKENRTPLSYAACRLRNQHTIQLLIDANADVNWKDIKGRSPLSYAAAECHNQPTIKLLLEAEAEVDSRDNFGRTPLSYASEDGHEGIIEQLLVANVNIDLEDQDGWTPLFYAVFNIRLGAIFLLLEANAGVGYEDKDGRTATSWAMKQLEHLSEYCNASASVKRQIRECENVVKLLQSVSLSSPLPISP